MSLLTNILGEILNFIYGALTNLGQEPNNISYYALALIIMSVLQKLLTMPLMLKQNENTQKTMAMSAEMQELQKKYQNDEVNFARKMQELHQKYDYKPTAGCLPMIISMVIIFAMLGVIRDPSQYIVSESFDSLQKNFFWIRDLTLPDNWVLPVLYSLSFLLYNFITQKTQPQNNMQNDQMAMTSKTMMYIMPVMFLFMSRNWASGLLLYWTTNMLIEVLVRGLGLIRARKIEEVDKV